MNLKMKKAKLILIIQDLNLINLKLMKKGEFFSINFSKQGIIELKSSSQDQALEIVRRRIDEIGTNEPNILKEVMIEF